jgi:23S rRNA (guanosine2251-2'-O)-methyltransferase
MQKTGEDVIFGVHPVMEALKSEATLDKVLVSRDMGGEQMRELRKLCKQASVMLKPVPDEKLNRITRKNHQGVIAFLSPIEFESIEQILPNLIEQGIEPRILILDGVTDVRNFGSIVRTVECMGFNAVVIPARSGVAINADAVKTSAGALFHVPICKEIHFGSILEFIANSGCKLVACSEKAEANIYKADLTGPIAVIMGDEGEGIHEKTLERSHLHVKIPLSGQTASLNVSVATGMVLSEVCRQAGL